MSRDFSFPYPPYEIQLNLMNEIYDCIEQGKVGVFESPTGTGKSLSVLCSTMTWLENMEKETEKKLRELAALKISLGPYSDKGKDWLRAYKETFETKRKIDEAIEKLEALEKIKERLKKAEEGVVETRKRKNDGDDVENGPKEEEDLGPEEYSSDTEEIDKKEAEEAMKTVKIYYASRTHSQLEQLVDELAKTRFKPRLVTIASRQALCANESVQKLKISHLINEKCMELRKNCGGCDKRVKTGEGEEPTKKSSQSGCPYYKQEAIEDLSNRVLARRLSRPNEVISRAQTSFGCPYFATRKSVPLCQLVLLPYQVLLHAATRAAWGVELENNVVVLDEAHNVLQTIGNIHSSEISSAGLKVALQLIDEYITTYKARLKTKNLMYMRLLHTVVTAFSRYLHNPGDDSVLTIQGFLIKLQLTDINLFKLVHYMEATDLCKKFHGFYLRQQKKDQREENEAVKLTGVQKLLSKNKEEPAAPETLVKKQPRAIPSPLFSIKSFLEALNNKCEDGRIIVDKTVNKLRFILLNPADQLRNVVDKARATILIGGTMEPAGLLIDCLTRGRDSSRVIRFSCEHVIDDNQLAALVVDKTIDGNPFTMTYQTRSNEQTLRSLALSLIELLDTVPNGSVVFFTSYDVMNTFAAALKKFNLFQRLQDKKMVYIEPRSGTTETNVWDKFVTSARSTKGAVLFAVVGGKMSEGINFSDELGRAVFMIGLPYPNKSSLELQENMKYLDGTLTGGGKQLYDSLCMHSVNQAIGRAIRHRRDYAAVFLFDSRFSQQSVQSQLSGWISKRVKTRPTFREILQTSKTFFSQHQ